jgi:CRP/FNR family transcriptional regulator, cyclic AMP receptor protein
MPDVDPALLRGVTLFSTCTDEQRARVARIATITRHDPGDLLTHEGSVGRRFHLVLEGAVSVERGGQEVATLRRGDFIGEIGLLGGGRATATVVSTQPTTCITLERETFWEMLESEPAITLRLLELVCRRMEEQWRAEPTGNLQP